MITDTSLRIAEIAPPFGGCVGITFAPGKKQSGALSGHHDRDLATDLDAVAAWNAAAVVTLLEPAELRALQIEDLGTEVRRRHMEWHHLPIPDVTAPGAAFDADWPAHSARLRALLTLGGKVLVHCKGGLGRAGTVAARLLVELGTPAAEAVSAVRAVRPGAIETGAQEQWVARGRRADLPRPAQDDEARRDRAVGALVGLAVGDAVGTTLEFSRKPALAALDDMVGGGPFRLAPGQWTDDTAMALALADSLLTDPGLDPTDLMARFVDWRERGTNSCTGHCFDIGNATRAALDRFARAGDPLAGSTDERAAGNGALMRLAPVAVRHWRDREELLRVAALQTRTTHGAPSTMRASATLAEMLADAVAGRGVVDVLSGPLADRVEGRWRGCHRDEVEGTGYVVDALRAAAWAVSRTTSFRSAVLLAANLGDDADTTAAVTGQLAGALYGLSGIPAEWVERLAWRDRLVSTAGDLFSASLVGGST